MHKKTGFNRVRQRESQTSRGQIPDNQMCRGTIAEGKRVVSEIQNCGQSQKVSPNIKT